MQNPQSHPEPLPKPLPAPLLEGSFAGRNQFQQLVRDAIATAAREGWREITLCDASFADWPLGERAVIEPLQAWSKTGRTLHLLAKRYDAVTSTHHRFVAWRGQWSHIVQARAVASADALDFPSAILSPGWVLHRIDPVRSQGICTTDPQRRVQLQELLAEWHNQSASAFAATTLGL